MEPQVYGWTCSACATDWVLRASGLDPSSTRDQVVHDIGYTENINPTYGLMDGSGSQLQRVISEHGGDSTQGWLDFDEVHAAVRHTTGMMSGANWYHWVALRGTAGPDALWIANSAPGYKGVEDILTRQDFDRLGSFSVVLLTQGN